MKSLLSRRALPLLAVLGMAACASTDGLNGSSPFSTQSSPALWSQLSQSSDTKQIMLLEAELASRGQESSGTEYIGRKTSSTVGKSRYGRSPTAIADRNCSDFASAAAAQKFFLASGGPTQDPHGLDRDGDGNACDWGRSLKSSAAKNKQKATSNRAASTKTRSASRRSSSSACYVGPRGGTYTITASGRKNYGGC